MAKSPIPLTFQDLATSRAIISRTEEVVQSLTPQDSPKAMVVNSGIRCREA